MSRESLGATEPDDVAGTALDDVPTTVLATISLDPVDGAPTASPDDDPGVRSAPQDDTTGTPSRTTPRLLGPPMTGRGRLVLAGAVTTALVIGVLGGGISARNQAQSRLEAGSRIVLALESDPRGYDNGTQLPDEVRLPASVSLVGDLGGEDGIRIDRVRTAIGELTVLPAITVRADRSPQPTMLRLEQVDCATVEAIAGPEGPTAAMFGGPTARARPVGSRTDVEVPVLVPNPGTLLLPLALHCSPGAVGGGVSYRVGDVTTRTDGSVTAVISPGTAFTDGEQGQFTLARPTGQEGSAADSYGAMRPVRATTDSATFEVPQTGWTVTTTPRLPLIATEPTPVTFRFGYTCPPTARGSAAPALPGVPELTVGTLDRAGRVTAYPDGWNGSVFRAAAIAAVVRACTSAEKS